MEQQLVSCRKNRISETRIALYTLAECYESIWKVFYQNQKGRNKPSNETHDSIDECILATQTRKYELLEQEWCRQSNSKRPSYYSPNREVEYAKCCLQSASPVHESGHSQHCCIHCKARREKSGRCVEHPGTEYHGHHEEEGNSRIKGIIDDSEQLCLTESADES